MKGIVIKNGSQVLHQEHGSSNAVLKREGMAKSVEITRANGNTITVSGGCFMMARGWTGRSIRTLTLPIGVYLVGRIKCFISPPCMNL